MHPLLLVISPTELQFSPVTEPEDTASLIQMKNTAALPHMVPWSQASRRSTLLNPVGTLHGQRSLLDCSCHTLSRNILSQPQAWQRSAQEMCQAPPTFIHLPQEALLAALNLTQVFLNLQSLEALRQGHCKHRELQRCASGLPGHWPGGVQPPDRLHSIRMSWKQDWTYCWWWGCSSRVPGHMEKEQGCRK